MQVIILWTVLLLAAVTAAVDHLENWDNLEDRDDVKDRDKHIEQYDENNFTVAIKPDT
jgi:hypothetical protein